MNDPVIESRQNATPIADDVEVGKGGGKFLGMTLADSLVKN